MAQQNKASSKSSRQGTSSRGMSSQGTSSRGTSSRGTDSRHKTGSRGRLAATAKTGSKGAAPHTDSKASPAQPLVMEELLSQLPQEARQVLENFDSIVQGVRPLSSKHLLRLPEQVRNLSHLLTDQRVGRRMGYLNDSVHLSAYIRYFQWWNLLRLTRLFAGLSPSRLDVPENGVCLDIGSGPLTLPIALWLARPDLREKKLTWYCLDYSHTALALGEELYLAVAARTIARQSATGEPWKIIRVKGELGVGIKERAHLITAANVFNEVVEESGKPPEFTAKRAADIFSHYAASKAQVLVVEPGTPPAARFLTAFRAAVARKNHSVVAPCPADCGSCPMDGSRGNKWCHFTFSTEDAPVKLQKFSSHAGLPKERASLAFVLTSSGDIAPSGKDAISQDKGEGAKDKDVQSKKSSLLEIRIVSEPINLPGNRIAHYGCCHLGLVLVQDSSGKILAPGQLVQVPVPASYKTDRKTGALLV